MNCEKACYESQIESCNDIVVKAGFPANFPLYWLISKSFSSIIIQRVTTTNAQGDLIIPISELPAGFLLKGNHYKINLKNGTDYMQPVTFVFGSDQYNCIVAELMNYNRDDSDNSGVNIIQFTEAIVPGGSPSGNISIVYAFVNQTSFTYNHNLGRIVDVTIYNLAGEILNATIQDDIINHNYIIVTFTSPTSGRILIQ